MRPPFGIRWIIYAISFILWIRWFTCMKVRSTKQRKIQLTLTGRRGTAGGDVERDNCLCKWDLRLLV